MHSLQNSYKAFRAWRGRLLCHTFLNKSRSCSALIFSWEEKCWPEIIVHSVLPNSVCSSDKFSVFSPCHLLGAIPGREHQQLPVPVSMDPPLEYLFPWALHSAISFHTMMLKSRSLQYGYCVGISVVEMNNWNLDFDYIQPQPLALSFVTLSVARGK